MIQTLADLSEETLIELYFNQKLSAIKIGKIFGVTETAIRDKMERFNLPRRGVTDRNRKYSYDFNYFEKIDTKDKAYFLGLFMADGCIQTSAGDIVIKLKEEDGYILELFNKYMKSDKPIYHISTPEDNHSDMKMLSFSHKKLCLDLNKLGVVDRKSLILEFPNKEMIPPRFLNHFVRGYFDGDGCITIPQNKPTLAHVDFCVSEAFGRVLKDITDKMGYNFTFFTQKENTIWHLATSGRQRVKKFLNWLYVDKGNLFLSRKYNKFLIVDSHNIKADKNVTSKYFGVYFAKRLCKFVGTITLKTRKTIHLGRFERDIDAAYVFNTVVSNFGLQRELNEINMENVNIEVLNRQILRVLSKSKFQEWVALEINNSPNGNPLIIPETPLRHEEWSPVLKN